MNANTCLVDADLIRRAITVLETAPGGHGDIIDDLRESLTHDVKKLCNELLDIVDDQCCVAHFFPREVDLDSFLAHGKIVSQIAKEEERKKEQERQYLSAKEQEHENKELLNSIILKKV